MKGPNLSASQALQLHPAPTCLSLALARSFTTSPSDTPPPPSINTLFDNLLSSQPPSQPTPLIELVCFFDCDHSFEVDTWRLFDTTAFARRNHALLTRLN